MNSLSGIYSVLLLGVAYCLAQNFDWRLLFNVSQRTQPSLSLQPTSARLTPWLC